MRKQLRSTLLASAVLLPLTLSPSWAAPGGVPGPNPEAPGQVKKAVPEIDRSAGGAGLTVFVIALLLAAERRSRSA